MSIRTVARSGGNGRRSGVAVRCQPLGFALVGPAVVLFGQTHWLWIALAAQLTSCLLMFTPTSVRQLTTNDHSKPSRPSSGGLTHEPRLTEVAPTPEIGEAAKGAPVFQRAGSAQAVSRLSCVRPYSTASVSAPRLSA